MTAIAKATNGRININVPLANATLLCLIYLRVNTRTSNDVEEEAFCTRLKNIIDSRSGKSNIPFSGIHGGLNNNSSLAFGNRSGKNAK